MKMNVKIQAETQLPEEVVKILESHGRGLIHQDCRVNDNPAIKITITEYDRRYVCRTTLSTKRGVYVAEAIDWDAIHACVDAMSRIRSQLPKASMHRR